MSTIELPPGIYHIVVGVISPFADSRLTRQENNGVTILPPSIEPDPKQEVSSITSIAFLTSLVAHQPPF